MKILGLDTSMTSTGVAVIVDGVPIVDLVTSRGTVLDPIPVRRKRIDGMVSRILDFASAVDLAVIESPVFSRVEGSPLDRASLWWDVVGSLLDDEVPVVEVSSAQRCLYATGSGTAGKVAVASAVTRRYGHLVDEFRTDDETDALVFAAMGARHLSAPIEASLPKANLAAMTKVRWPE